MKKILVFAVLFYCAMHTNAQDIKRKVIRGTTSTQLKNAQVVIDNQTFDYRVLRYYPEDELRDLNTVKRSQIFYIYTQSYKVLNMDNCASVLDIDINILENLRDKNITKTIDYGNNCKIKIELLSKEELQKQLTEIANN